MARRQVRAELGRQRVTIEVELGECLTDDARLLEGAELGVDEHHEIAIDPAEPAFPRDRKLEALDTHGDARTRGERAELFDHPAHTLIVHLRRSGVASVARMNDA